MANEISIRTRLNFQRGGFDMTAQVSETLDQTGDNAIENVQIIGATSEALSLGDVTGTAHLMFKNLNPAWSSLTVQQKAAYTDQADYETKQSVYIGTENPTTKLNALMSIIPQGGFYMLTSTLAWYAIRDTNNVNLLVVAIEV